MLSIDNNGQSASKQQKEIMINKDKYIVNRKYNFNEHFFKDINSNEKAYILGLIASYGNIDSVNNNITICLKNGESEVELLNKISRIIEYDGNLKYKKNNNSVILCLTSYIMKQDLINIGIIPNKTFLMDLDFVIKSVPKKFLSDFLRGYFDGDGCISISNQKYKNKIYNIPNFNITLPTKNIDTLIKAFNPCFNFTISEEKRSKGKISYIRASARKKIEFIFNKMYYDNCLCLSRKKDVFVKYLYKK